VPAAAPKSACVYIYLYGKQQQRISCTDKDKAAREMWLVMNSAFFPVINENSLGAFGVDKRGNGRAESRLSRTLR
jgi:hypothetical protein